MGRTDQFKSAYDQHGEKVRFLLVGGWNTAFSYGLFAALLTVLKPILTPFGDSSIWILRWSGEHYYLVVQLAGWCLAVPPSTLALKYLAFRSKGHWLSEIGRSYFVYAPLQVLSFLLLWLFSGILNLNPLLGQLLTAGASAIFSYLGHKRITFRHL